MLRPIDKSLQQYDNNITLCMQFLKEYILKKNFNLTESVKYGMPFFSYKKKMCCYLWVDKKLKQPYIGIVDGNHIHHPMLVKGNRIRMKVLFIDPNKDFPLDVIDDILMQICTYHKTSIN